MKSIPLRFGVGLLAPKPLEIKEIVRNAGSCHRTSLIHLPKRVNGGGTACTSVLLLPDKVCPRIPPSSQAQFCFEIFPGQNRFLLAKVRMIAANLTRRNCR